jgi:hypothetical protein
VFENLTVKMKLPEDGTNECRNVLEYKLNSVTWCIRSDELTLSRRSSQALKSVRVLVKQCNCCDELTLSR